MLRLLLLLVLVAVVVVAAGAAELLGTIRVHMKAWRR